MLPAPAAIPAVDTVDLVILKEDSLGLEEERACEPDMRRLLSSFTAYHAAIMTCIRRIICGI